ncbi:MAG: flavoprotein [Pseudomonadota bacterium]
MAKGNIIFALTGSIACYKACFLISKLVQSGFVVQTIATDSALKFIGKSTLEGLTSRPVYLDMFDKSGNIEHVSLPKWADLAIVCPATANSINKFSHGIADDLLTSIFLAYDLKKPFLIAPAMNHNMFNHPATKESFLKLKKWGVKVLESEYGMQACKEEGDGRLLDPMRIYEEIINTFGGI